MASKKATVEKQAPPVKKPATRTKKTTANKVSKSNITYDELLKMAKEYGVDNNALFQSAAYQYDVQMRVIEMIRKEIESATNLTCEKVYRGKEKNEYAAPLIRELPRHAESANKTLLVMVDIINKLGRPVKKESALSMFEKEYD